MTLASLTGHTISNHSTHGAHKLVINWLFRSVTMCFNDTDGLFRTRTFRWTQFQFRDSYKLLHSCTMRHHSSAIRHCFRSRMCPRKRLITNLYLQHTSQTWTTLTIPGRQPTALPIFVSITYCVRTPMEKEKNPRARRRPCLVEAKFQTELETWVHRCDDLYFELSELDISSVLPRRRCWMLWAYWAELS